MIELIVAEKPSVARDIARVLSADTRRDGFFANTQIWVSWCLGHMGQLCEPHVYDPSWRAWHVRSLPMIPKTFEVAPIPSHLEQWQKLQALLQNKQVHRIINACDAGREGELIFRFVMQMANCHKPVRRLWLHALTDVAIRHGMQKLKPASDFDALAAAARCRAEADWLVGMNATRAMTLCQRPQQGGQGALFPVGRVQTPTLSLVVAREQAIENFSATPYWQIEASFEHENGAYRGILVPPRIMPPGSLPPAHTSHWPTERILTQPCAQAMRQAMQAEQHGVVIDAEYKQQAQRCPMLYDLTSLQRRANIQAQLTAQQTLDAAQSLYERHKVLTYPRTDSDCLPTLMADSLPTILKRLQNSDYAPWVDPLLHKDAVIDPRMLNDREVGDHHAIIPTGRLIDKARLSQHEQQVFDLVLRRFLAAFYPPAQFATSRIETAIGTHTFRSRGKTLLQKGWREVDPPVEDRIKAFDKRAPQPPPILPHVNVQSQVGIRKIDLLEAKTSAPKRYTEASLLGAMEHAGRTLEDAHLKRALKDEGLGTPATRANIIETLKKRQLVRLDNKALQPTAHGRLLIEKIPVPSLKSAQLTGEWEARLGQVAQGQLSRPEFMRQVAAFTTGLVEQIVRQAPQGSSPVSQPVAQAPRPRTGTRRKKPPAGKTQEVPSADSARRQPLEPDRPLALDCPICQSPITRHPKVYTCARPFVCTFVIFTKIAKRPIALKEVQQLIRNKKTKTLSGFLDRNGKPFQAALHLNTEGRVDFDFDSQSN